VVIEACWNWGVLYDLLEDTAGVAKVVLSHPAKNRIIADAQIKNDRIDAKALATLLRGDFVARVHVPSRDVRQRKNVVRQRLWLARVRTMIRNRIHCVIDRHPLLARIGRTLTQTHRPCADQRREKGVETMKYAG